MQRRSSRSEPGVVEFAMQPDDDGVERADDRIADPEGPVVQHRDRATVSLLRSGQRSDEELAQLVEQLDANGRLNSSIAFRALSQGDLAFFEVAMARLAALPLVNARALIHDQGELGLQAILQAALTATRKRQSANTH